jgi:lipoprotein-releasing system ATP-binding protein
MLKLEDIHKSYQDLHVLKGISIEVKTGEIVTIVGKSGAGKSTLLHIAGTLDNPDSGTIQLDGQALSGLSSNKLADIRNTKVGFVFQFHYLLPEFSALENVCIPALIAGTNERNARKKAKELLEYLGLSDRIEHKPDELSGGEQQRVAMARALINDPKIVFADEPTGNLDTQTSDEMHNLLLKLREDLNQTFIIVTHNNELAKLSDRTLVMEDGRIVAERGNGQNGNKKSK